MYAPRYCNSFDLIGLSNSNVPIDSKVHAYMISSWHSMLSRVLMANKISRRASSRWSLWGLCSGPMSYQRSSSLGRHGTQLYFPFLSASLTDYCATREIRRVLSTQIKKGSTSERVEKILALMIESGFVYCLLWVIAVSPLNVLQQSTEWHFAAGDILVERVQHSSRCRRVHRQHRHAFSLGAYQVLVRTELLYSNQILFCSL